MHSKLPKSYDSYKLHPSILKLDEIPPHPKIAIMMFITQNTNAQPWQQYNKSNNTCSVTNQYSLFIVESNNFMISVFKHLFNYV